MGASVRRPLEEDIEGYLRTPRVCPRFRARLEAAREAAREQERIEYALFAAEADRRHEERNALARAVFGKGFDDLSDEEAEIVYSATEW